MLQKTVARLKSASPFDSSNDYFFPYCFLRDNIHIKPIMHIPAKEMIAPVTHQSRCVVSPVCGVLRSELVVSGFVIVGLVVLVLLVLVVLGLVVVGLVVLGVVIALTFPVLVMVHTVPVVLEVLV